MGGVCSAWGMAHGMSAAMHYMAMQVCRMLHITCCEACMLGMTWNGPAVGVMWH